MTPILNLIMYNCHWTWRPWKSENSTSVGSRTVRRVQDWCSLEERGGSTPDTRTSFQSLRTWDETESLNFGAHWPKSVMYVTHLAYVDAVKVPQHILVRDPEHAVVFSVHWKCVYIRFIICRSFEAWDRWGIFRRAEVMKFSCSVHDRQHVNAWSVERASKRDNELCLCSISCSMII